MKLQTAFRVFLFSSLSCACYGASLAFPSNNGAANGDALGLDWSQSATTPPSTAADKLAYYTTTGGYEGVSVGAVYDDYAGTGGSFTVGHGLDPVTVGGATIDSWFFQINSPSGGFPELNDYSIQLKDSLGANLLTISLSNTDSTHWSASANGNAMLTGLTQGYVLIDGFYKLTASFNPALGFTTSITSYDGLSSMSYTDSSLVTAGKTFGNLGINETLGSAGSFGDGFITVVPEPSAAILSSLVPAFLLIRRRRR
ncbi:MAG: hypothetical protein ABIT37_18780 [Luteolibacter sp.]